jgi:hypothetical protein
MEQLFSWPWVEAQVAQTIYRWTACAACPLPPGPQYTPQEQMRRESAYDAGLEAVEREAKKAPRSRDERLEAQQRIVAVFPRFASIALGLDDTAVQLLTDGFLPVGTELARWASRFDPSLSMPSIIQACRNAWTACGLQPLLGDRMAITPSILGYSLLYPYSDNYMDHEKVTTAEKLTFSARFSNRLRGLHLLPRNHHEAAVWAMVQLIEEQFPRLRYLLVFDCLLAIHRAQEASIAQLKGCYSENDAELLQITCAKGGTSVLADACLSHGWLNLEESLLAFEWGVLLQLGDDLQDVREDLRRGSVTLFTLAATTRVPLDSLVVQLLNFSNQVAARMDRLPHGTPALKDLLRMSWRSLIHMAVAKAPEFFTPSFLAELEPCSPFRFAFLRARNKRLSGRGGLYKVLFDAFLEAGDADNSALPQPEFWLERSLAPGSPVYISSSLNIGCGMSLR